MLLAAAGGRAERHVVIRQCVCLVLSVSIADIRGGCKEVKYDIVLYFGLFKGLLYSANGGTYLFSYIK